MVCVPCIFIGFAVVLWCKFLEPYLRPIYEKLCQHYPPLRSIGNYIGTWLVKIEKFGEKIGIKMPESCPMPKKRIVNKANDSKPSADTNENKLYPDLESETQDKSELHHRSTAASTLVCD